MNEPLPIRRLNELLINRIAAGEVIHRPASALKELIENSLDAGSTSIRVAVKDGGMKLLQIQDNGCGINKEDLPILAERFTTSKLSSFNDLSHIRTYGFRGEALASISHVSHLKVTTKTRSDACAWRAMYVDGTLTEAKAGENATPKPCAGNDGTTIDIEDLFYNTPTRLSALRGPSEEYTRILDVLTKYATHNSHVSFVCRKAGSASPDLMSPSSSHTTNTIRLLYGNSVAKELITIRVSSENLDDLGGDDQIDLDVPESWIAEAHVSNANYQSKKMNFLLFINHRLVESPRMKRAFEAVYNPVLPKGSSPFIYLSLEIDPRSVDVNVHPTKREVHFINEEKIIEKVSDAIQKALAAQSHSRAFEYQTLLTGGLTTTGIEASRKRKRQGLELETGDEERDDESSLRSPKESVVKNKVLSRHKVRTSQNVRKLDSMFPQSNSAQFPSNPTRDLVNAGISQASNTRFINETECTLMSIESLREKVSLEKHMLLTEILENHVFVGIVDLQRSLSLIQHTTNLYLLNHGSFAEELFYQLALRQFGNYRSFKLEPPPSLHTLLEIAVNADNSARSSSLSTAQIVDYFLNTLMEHRQMLSEHFSLKISDTGLVESFPLLLRDYSPNSINCN